MPHRTIRLVLQQLIPARAVYGVIKRGTSAILQAMDAGFEQLNVIGEVLRYLATTIEAYYKCTIKIRPERVLQATDCSLFFSIKAAADRSAGIKRQAQSAWHNNIATNSTKEM